jgi:hypothetical protein
MSDGRAFYARSGSRAADVVSLLHPPYTLWHLSYVAIGAAIAPAFSPAALAWTLLVFLLGLGIAAHALDELRDRPLGTRFGDTTLVVMAVTALAIGAAVVVAGALTRSGSLLAWAALGLFFAVGYPLEWPRLLHTDLGFGIAWGGYPVLAAYWVQAEALSMEAIVIAGFAVLFSLAQRALSTPARFVRRGTTTAVARFDDSTWERPQLLATWEGPLRWLTLAVVTLAAGLVLAAL